MAYWNAYFAIKLYLAWTERLHPVWWLNLLLVLLLLLPTRHPPMPRLRQTCALLIAVALVVLETPGVMLARLPDQLQALGQFSLGYQLELAARVLLPILPWIGGLAVLAYVATRRLGQKLALTLLVLAALPLWYGAFKPSGPAKVQTMRSFSLSAAGPPASRATTEPVTAPRHGANADHDAQLAAFRAAEARHRVRFTPMSSDPAEQFDIIVLHVCSLSWDDLNAAGAARHPLLARLDYLFEDFSSGTSYSNPTAIRLLRAACGQQPHEALFRPTSAGCHLFAQLAHAGYVPQALFNHDGEYGRFREVVEREIGIDGVKVRVPTRLPTAMVAFDGSSLARDEAVLRQWHDERVRQPGPPVALYYNTVTLHDGNRMTDSRLNSTQSYPLRLNTLLADVGRLVDWIERSGRRAAIVLVPEHGAALRGSAHHVAGMREVPTPDIIHVPVGVILAGLPASRRNPGGPIRITTPSSYPALAQLLANLVGDSPYRRNAPALADYAADLPRTEMVGENEGVLTMRTAQGYVVRTAREGWLPAH